MCVLYVCKSDVPDLEVLERAWISNPHGAGVAWREDGGRVAWLKGIPSAREVYEIARNLPLPLLIHLRWDSVGNKSPRLTHPFPLETAARAELHGTAKAVVAHNGHVAGWESILKSASVKLGAPPEGPWSDTRTMAWLGARSRQVLNIMARGQRVAILDKDGAHVLNKHLWACDPKETGGYWASKDYRRAEPVVAWVPTRGWTAERYFGERDERDEERDTLAEHAAWLERERKKARESFTRERRRGRSIWKSRVVA